ncbi:Ninja-family protein [Thalictrum thalictroides]|uniref:Ninja-family protein n=1 Tax=Thalictrum thalictroides TaxID=46969 RepID=A0A7J6X661_THATH|nr:Ninja-family protein [Thalictrum thalictroides]
MGNEYMRDLLQRFSEKTHQQPFVAPETEEVEELNLGLSLGGLFGAKPKESSNNLYRSSSNACFTTFWKEDDGLSLTRTSSLPVETEEETRKRKGCHIVRQLEVMKKRSENNSNNRRSFVGDKGVEKWVKMESPQEMDLGGFPLPLSQGSIGSQGSGSSGISELENQSAQGTNNDSESKSPGRVLSVRDQEDHTVVKPYSKPIKKSDITAEAEIKNSLQKPSVLNSCSSDIEPKVMEEMPYVSTKGDGPNGKRIEGLLFKYKKGEEVRIVCVCHGTFHTPAEFIKHAGGDDVAHPLRHIVMSSRSSSL